MAERTLNRATVEGLASKLDEFGQVLTAEERAVLLGLLGLASSAIDQGSQAAETESGSAANVAPKITLTPNMPRLSDAFKSSFTRLPLGDGSPVADSVGVGVGCVSWSKDYNRGTIDSSRINPGNLVRTAAIPGLRTQR